MSHAEAARLSFDLIEVLTEDGPENAISTDNFTGLLTVLEDFATAASTQQEQLQQRGRRVESLSSSR